MVTTKATDKNLSYLAMDDQYVNPVFARSVRIVVERAQGSWLYDMNGDAYLDFSCGIAVTNVGHCHPRVVQAIKEQSGQLMHISAVAHHKRYIELAGRLAEIAPGNLDSVFLANSGAEAVDGAIKMVRYITGRPGVIAFRGAFHGRTLLATALTTSKAQYRERYDPLPPSIYTVPYPYVYRSSHRDNPEACVKSCLQDLQHLFDHVIRPEHVGAIIVEPVLGEGGYVVPPPGFLPALSQMTKSYGILLIADEVQTGFGRTGKMFAVEHVGVVPDVMLMAKGIAGGMPLSGFIASKEITKNWKSGRHGTTYGGNPVCCAAALAVIDVLQEEHLVKRSAELGAMMLKRLQTFAQGKPHIGEVRGLGLMIGIELNDERGEPGSELAKLVAKRCIENKLIVLTCGTYGQVIRLIPPLNTSDEEAEKGLAILEKCLIV